MHTPPRPRWSGPAWLALAAAMALLPACAPRTQQPKGYYGPTLPMAQVVEAINARNAALPTLYSRLYLEASIYNPDTKKHQFVNTGGDLFLRKPRDFLLRGRKDVVGSVIEIGSTLDRYWMTVYEGEEAMWWGWHRNVGKPCAKGMPIRPDAVGEVLGIGRIDPDFTRAPVPTMRFNNDMDVYMLVWNAPLPDRWYAEREVWYDRQTLLPRKVLFFDRDGRIVLRADLSAHRPVEVPDVAPERLPRIATEYDIFFPETRSTMTLRLSDMAPTTKTGQPREGMIRFPEDPGVPKVVQIDADCE